MTALTRRVDLFSDAAKDVKKLSSRRARRSLRHQRNIIADATRCSSTESRIFFVLTAHLAVTR